MQNVGVDYTLIAHPYSLVEKCAQKESSADAKVKYASLGRGTRKCRDLTFPTLQILWQVLVTVYGGDQPGYVYSTALTTCLPNCFLVQEFPLEDGVMLGYPGNAFFVFFFLPSGRNVGKNNLLPHSLPVLLSI